MYDLIHIHNKGLQGYTVTLAGNHKIKQIIDRKSFFRDMQEMWRVATLDETEQYPSVQLLQENEHFKKQVLKNFEFLVLGTALIALGSVVILVGALLMNPIPLAIGALLVVSGLTLCVTSLMALHRQRADKKAILFDDNALLLRVNQETISSHASASISNLMLIKNDFEAAENACVEPTICVKKTARSKPIQEKVSNPLNAYACDMKNATDSICSAYQSFSTWINSVWARKTTSLLITQREASLAEIDCAVKKVSFVLDKFQAVKGKDNKPCSFTQRFIKHYELDTHLESLKKIQSDWTSLDF